MFHVTRLIRLVKGDRMYRPGPYREDDQDRLLSLIADNPFGILVSASSRLEATHLMFLIEEEADGNVYLVSHMAKANPQWSGLTADDEVMVIFSASDAYISPRWYSAEPDVPTWNYEAAHAYGRWETLTGWDATRRLLERTIRHFERPFSEPWGLGDIPPEVADAFQKAVVAFRIKVERIEGVRKLSQDKKREDVDGVVNGLAASPETSRMAQKIRAANERRWKVPE